MDNSLRVSKKRMQLVVGFNCIMIVFNIMLFSIILCKVEVFRFALYLGLHYI